MISKTVLRLCFRTSGRISREWIIHRILVSHVLGNVGNFICHGRVVECLHEMESQIQARRHARRAPDGNGAGVVLYPPGIRNPGRVGPVLDDAGPRCLVRRRLQYASAY